jgi:hypothetical protein
MDALCSQPMRGNDASAENFLRLGTYAEASQLLYQ